MSLQRSACCRCAVSNCCPGLVSSQCLVSIKCTCRWFTSRYLYGTLVLTKNKLLRNKPRAWMETLLKNYKYWLAFDWTGGTAICIRDTIALATQCSPACLNSKKRKTTQAVKTLPTLIKEKRMPRAEAPCIPFTKMILLMRVERSLLESAPGASKFASILDRMSMKLPSWPGDFVIIKTKLFK
eukprot:738465-Pelagomonas_calceolata.AAC.1